MSKTLEGMARAICLAIWDHDYTPRDTLHPDARWVQAMKAAKAGAGFLADNVTDEMVEALHTSLVHSPPDRWLPSLGYAKAISAALRAAAGSALEAKP